MANRCQSAAARIDREDSDAVVTAIRTIDKAPIPGNVNVRTPARARKILWQSAQGLQLSKISFLRTPRKGSHSRKQFVNHEDALAAGMKSQVARSRAWLDLHPRL